MVKATLTDRTWRADLIPAAMVIASWLRCIACHSFTKYLLRTYSAEIPGRCWQSRKRQNPYAEGAPHTLGRSIPLVPNKGKQLW